MKWILENWEKGLGLLSQLLGRSAAIALLLIVFIALALSYAGQLVSDADVEIDYALFISFFFGLIIVAYGVFTTQEVHGLEAGKGLSVGVLAGASAALTGGAFYYALNMPDCANPSSSAKFLVVLAGSVPLGGILGALFGLARLTSQKRDPAPQQPPAPEFLSFVLGTFILIVVCIVFIFIFSHVQNLLTKTQVGPQGFIRFWQVSLIASSFLIVYIGLIVYLYGRPEVQQTTSFRFEKTISSVLAALFCTIVLFGPVSWFLRQTDFEPRQAALVAGANRCFKDPIQQNLLSNIIILVGLLILLEFGTYLAATYPRSPLLRVLDKWIWDKHQPEGESG